MARAARGKAREVTSAELQTAIIGVATAFVVRLLTKWLGLKRAEETRSAVTWALEQAVALVALKIQGAHGADGAQKKAEALRVAESLAPKEMKRLDDDTKSVLVDATYARLKTSLPSPALTHPDDDIPVDVVLDPEPKLSDRPTPLPPLRGPVGPGAKGGPTR